MNTSTSRWVVGTIVVVALALLPLISSDFFIEFAMTRVLMLGVVASSMVFLASQGGRVSLAQWLLFGVAGFAVGNVVATSGRGLLLGWSPWAGVVIALIVVTALALLLGILSARSTDIYFLMLTLTYAIIGFFFFGQVTTFSGFGGVTGIDPPSIFVDNPQRLYYAALLCSVGAYILFRYVSRTPFGIALQGIRDDPIRMASLGYNVLLHRALAFGLAGFVAGVAGILNIWWNGQIDPTSISIGPTLDLLIIAVIGGIAYLEGAWLGAFVFVGANIYLRDIPLLGDIGGVIEERILSEDRFNTVVGLILLIVMVASPNGVSGAFVTAKSLLTSSTAPPSGDLEIPTTTHTPRRGISDET